MLLVTRWSKIIERTNFTWFAVNRNISSPFALELFTFGTHVCAREVGLIEKLQVILSLDINIHHHYQDISAPCSARFDCSPQSLAQHNFRDVSLFFSIISVLVFRLITKDTAEYIADRNSIKIARFANIRLLTELFHPATQIFVQRRGRSCMHTNTRANWFAVTRNFLLRDLSSLLKATEKICLSIYRIHTRICTDIQTHTHIQIFLSFPFSPTEQRAANLTYHGFSTAA